MALSRTTKIWLIVLSIPIVLIVVGVIVLKMLFTSERLKSYIVPQIEESTQRTVTVHSMSLSVFPSLAVDVNGLAIANSPEEGFSKKPMLQLDRLVLDVKLFELLKGNIEVSTVTLERPQIFIEVNSSGIANYTRKEVPAAAPAPQSSVTVEVKSGGYAVLLSNLEIINGSLEYVDHEGNSTTTLEGMHHKIRAFAPADGGDITVEARSEVESFSYGSVTQPLVSNLKFTSIQTMVYNVKQDLLKLQPGTATVQEIPLTVSGEVAQCTQVPEINLLVESDKVSIPEILSLVPKEYMKRAEGVKGNGIAKARIEVKGTVTDSTNPDITGMISATDASIQYPQLPKPITNVNIVADFTRAKTKQEFKMTKFSASLGSNVLSATMTVLDFDDPSLTMTLTAAMNLAEVKDYFPLEAGTELSGGLKANIELAGKVSAPAAMKAGGSMDFQDVTIKTASSKNPVQHLNGRIAFNNQLIEAKKLSMTLGRSDLSLSFSMKNYLSLMSEDKKAPKATATLALNSNHLYTTDIMGDEKSATSADPKLTAPKRTGSEKESAPTRSQGAPKAGVPLPDAEMDVTATIGTMTMEKFEMKNVRGTMKISNGIIDLQQFTCNAFAGSIATKGSLNMQKPDRPAFDLAFDMKNVDAHALLPKFTSFGERIFGTLSMTTTMKGNLNDTMGLVTQGLHGQGKVAVQEGKLTGVKVNQSIASLLKLPDVEEVTFRDWVNSFTISDGRINIKDLKISALGADYLVNGSQGLDGSLDYSMSMLLSDQASTKVTVPGVAGEAAKMFKEPNGRVKLDFAVGGTSDNPKVSLDTKAAQKKAEDMVKQKVSEEGKKIGEEAKKKAGDVLKDLLKKKK